MLFTEKYSDVMKSSSNFGLLSQKSFDILEKVLSSFCWNDCQSSWSHVLDQILDIHIHIAFLHDSFLHLHFDLRAKNDVLNDEMTFDVAVIHLLYYIDYTH